MGLGSRPQAKEAHSLRLQRTEYKVHLQHRFNSQRTKSALATYRLHSQGMECTHNAQGALQRTQRISRAQCPLAAHTVHEQGTMSTCSAHSA